MDEIKTDNKLETKTDKPLREYVRFRINAKVLKNVLSLISSVTKTSKYGSEPVKIVFTRDQLENKAVDPSHVEMIMTTVKKELFMEYDVRTDVPESNGTVTLGVDIDKLLLILKTSKKDDYLELEYDSIIDPCSMSVKTGLFTHKINLCNTDGMPDPKMPHLELPARFTIGTSELKDFLTQAGGVSDHFTIETSTNKVYLLAESDTDKVDMYPSVSSLLSNSTHKSLFAIDYFSNAISKLKSLFVYVDVFIGSDHPVKIQGHDFKDSGTGYIDVVILIAPRIESE